MATFDQATNINAGTHPVQTGQGVFVLEATIDMATVRTQKGGALVAGDIVESVDIPANTLILAAGIEVITAFDSSTDGTTWHLGVTGADVDNFASAVDLEDSAAGTYFGVTTATHIVGGTADTLDFEMQAVSTAPTTGSVRIFAVCIPIDAKIAPGVPALGS